ncbi:APC family permease [Fructilactobacillus florum]|uniref:Amino acid permease n=1 Tax=Fructilactobacillus florum DSM 22689 = JCM 16035 TaxID=1423745 RepID=A0A0R2CLQ7_9LACO|nr:APC family permease [Fructilactobacillus florum]EKK20024.1 transport protein [Fructilactobacillus florum 2F]KRM92543.1 amino acid permease [Fructilactobacillus florum DSM 22689 = JCM 16035]
MWRYLKRLIIGRPLKSSDVSGQSLTKFKGLALLSSDALSSVAYGTEQITAVLITLSTAALMYQMWVALLVLILLAAITLSYRQIIYAYPSGGGAYVVARTNWGEGAGLVAGGSLLVDYMLTVAVSTTSGTEAITSAIPSLYAYQVPIAIFIVLFIMVLNLRGMSDSASFLVIPVYLFILMILVMIVWGGYNILSGNITYRATAPVTSSVQGMSLLLFFKAFSSGSASLTGVEAISNAVPNFKDPKRKNAANTLALMAIILALFFAGITFLSYYMGIVPSAKDTVLSQIGMGVFGHGFFYYVLQMATALILAVAANTGFSAFPILAFNMAKDKYLPHAYLDKGDRLGYSNGIISLAIGAIVLILIFNGKTNLLIPLYAVGVFVPFTLSQSGMIVHWLHHRDGFWPGKALINLVGAAISAILVVFLFILHFVNVWPYLIIMPLILYMFNLIHNHYKLVAAQLRIRNLDSKQLEHHYDGSTVIVLVGNVTQVTREAISYAKSIGDMVIAVHVSFDSNPEHEVKIEQRFRDEYPDIRFVNLHTSYRSINDPVLRFCDVISRKDTEQNYSTTVLVPQFVPRRHWQHVLHNQTALRLRAALNSRQDIIVSTYNYHLDN